MFDTILNGQYSRLVSLWYSGTTKSAEILPNYPYLILCWPVS